MKRYLPIFLALSLFFAAGEEAAAQLVPPIDQPVRAWVQEGAGGRHFHADDILQYIPIAMELSLGRSVSAAHPLRERVALGLTSYAVMITLVGTTKALTAMTRPDGGEHSFPSGHTASAFLGAELVRLDYGNAYGTAAYAIAITTGFLRIYNDRHWLSDVVCGAAAGIFSAHVAHWLLPFERRLLGWDNSAAVVALPYAAPGHYGFSLAMRF